MSRLRWPDSTNSVSDDPGTVQIDSSPDDGGRVVIGSDDRRLYMLDRESGEKLWRFDTGAPLSASPAIATAARL